MYIEGEKVSDDQMEDQKLQRQPEVADNLDGKGITPKEKPGEQQQWSCIREGARILVPATGGVGEHLQTVSTSPRKKLKVYKSDEDCISNLPDCIISHILSQLSTKDAVATSVLSRNWRYKWTSIYDIYLYVYYLSRHGIGGDTSIQSFRSFLNRILLSNDSLRIRTFHLTCGWQHSKDVEEWITAVFRRDVQNLLIITPKTDSFVSPQCFSGWSLLTELKLHLKCTLGVSRSNCLSSLINLSLSNGVHMKNEESHNTRRVELIFPVLETLELRNCEWIDIDYVEIVAPKLIIFKSQSSQHLNCRFVINAPAVTHASLDHLRSARFARWACTALNGFRNLVRLVLSGNALMALEKEKSMLDFSTHVRLKEFEISNGVSYDGVLLEFLHLLPYVQSISLNMMVCPCKVDIVEPLPLCIRSHLKEFIYTRCSGETSDVDMAAVELILKNAKNLQMVTLISCTSELQRQFSEIIPQGSCIHLQTKKCDIEPRFICPI